jgi:hypothetical protein
VAGWLPGIEVGLALRLNAFRDVEAPDVYGALATFYEKRGAVLVSERGGRRSHDLRERRGRWCILEWDAGWEWKVRREAQLHVSRQLGVAGLLVFVYDGDYWGYELFDRGEAKDHFVQTTMDPMITFAGEDCTGDAAIVARTLALNEADVAPYLARWHGWHERAKRADERARPGDEFTRWEECAALDFLRAIGIEVRLDGYSVEFGPPIWRSFRPSFGDSGR